MNRIDVNIAILNKASKRNKDFDMVFCFHNYLLKCEIYWKVFSLRHNTRIGNKMEERNDLISNDVIIFADKTQS